MNALFSPVNAEQDAPAGIIFFKALKMHPDEREAFLKQECGTDTTLRAEVDGMLRDHEGAGSFLSGDDVVSAGLKTEIACLLPEETGGRIGPYKLLQQIGEGGCGVVWMAEQEEPVRRRVAVKVIKLGMDTKQVIARFEAERQALALMEHPNIAKVLDAGATEAGRPYFVMELVRGVKITTYCGQNNLPTEARLALFTQICQAIQHAHQKGIIHRDIKPSNVLVTLHDGVPVPKVIDFGIAKATTGQQLTDKTIFTAFEQFIGTPAYMSPEQAEMSGLDIDTRSDIYALGVLLYELLTGQTPFDAKELLASGLDAMRRTIRETDPPKPSTRLTQSQTALALTGQSGRSEIRNQKSEPSGARQPAKGSPKGTGGIREQIDSDLDWIVMKALEKDRTRRYESASSLAKDIQRHLDDEPVTARPPGNFYRFRKLVRRNKGAFAAASAVLAALIIGLGVSTWMFFNEKAARERAVAAEKEQGRLRELAETQEAVAKTEAGKSHQVAQFLGKMLKGVGPSVALGRDTTLLREVLERTEERLAEDLEDQPEVAATLGDIIGTVYWTLGDYEKAEKVHAKALGVRRSIFGHEHPDVARSLNALACDLADGGKTAEAEALYREALDMARRLGNDRSFLALTMGNLASVINDSGRFAEAEALQREALELEKAHYGHEHPAIVTSLDSLGLMLLDQGRPAEAETILREALGMGRKLQPGDNPQVATTFNNLALTLIPQNKLAEAEEIQREALGMKRKLLRNEHPEVATAMLNLAHSLRRQSKLDEAESLYRESLAMNRKLLGDEHPHVGVSLNGLALALHYQGKGPEAEILLRESESIMRKSKGDQHPDLAQILENLADIMEGQQKHSEAETLRRDALTIRRKLLDENHSRVTAARKHPASELQKQGKPANFSALFSNELAAARASAATDPVKFENRLYSLADGLYRRKEFSEAEPLYRELIASRTSRLDAEHDDVIGPTASLGRLLTEWAWTLISTTPGVQNPDAEERAREAERLLRNCLTIRLRNVSEPDGRAGDVRSRLGGAVVVLAVADPGLTTEARSAKFAEAEALLLEGSEALQNLPRGRWSNYQRDALTRLVRLYEAWGKPAEAAVWQAKLAAFENPRENPQSKAAR